MTTDTIAIEDARAIIGGLNPGALARRVWRAVSEGGGREDNVAAVLDLTDGTLVFLTWRAGDVAIVPRRSVVLAWMTDLARERTWRSLSEISCLAPSFELAEEEVARRATGEGVYWPHVEDQLRCAYAVVAARSER